MIVDESTEFGARVAAHLRDETVAWMTVVTRSGAPLPMPVWFLWEGGESVLMWSMDGARIRNLEANPNVTLNFAGNGQGGDIVVLSGTATVARDAPSADRVGAYVQKYEDRIASMNLTPEEFGARYSVPVQIALTKLRGH